MVSALFISLAAAHEGEEEEEVAAKPTLLHWIVDHYTWIAGVVISIALVITILKSIKSIFKLAISWGILLIGLYLVYSLVYTVSLPKEEQERVVTCFDTGCKISIHVHAYVDAQLCGEQLQFPLEEGALDEPHTHKEKNRIHVHDSFDYDNATNQILDTTKLTLGAFFDQNKVRFTENCIDKYCNGDLCNGNAGTFKVWVNVTESSQQELTPPEFRQYLWHDEENIKIRFE